MVKVAVVTGGSRGIGAATARALAQHGWSVAIGYRSAAGAAAEVVADCHAIGVEAVAVSGDVATAAGVAALFTAADRLGRLDVLVNNAGAVDHRARVDEMSPDRLQRMFGVNAIGPFLCAGEAVRRMSTRHGGQGGAIVNIGSVAARLGSPDQYVDYAAAKGAVDTLTLGLAKEVAAEGIRVNCVRPGIVDTDIHASGGEPDRVTRMAGAIPVGRAGRPEEIAAAVVWLCSDAASYTTGAVLDVSGAR